MKKSYSVKEVAEAAENVLKQRSAIQSIRDLIQYSYDTKATFRPIKGMSIFNMTINSTIFIVDHETSLKILDLVKLSIETQLSQANKDYEEAIRNG